MLAHRKRIVYTPIIGTAGLLYTVPSLALFVLLPQVLGTRILDPLNIIVALTVYTVALLVRVVTDALASVPEETIQAATAMGYRGWQRFLLVELPVGIPVISAGMRVAAVSNVSLVSIAALLGIPQIGSLFTQGFQLRFYTPIIAGIILCLVLALVLDGIIMFITRRLTPWTPKVVTS
nr:ABC transporter permease subunit [Lysinibacter cavernae]